MHVEITYTFTTLPKHPKTSLVNAMDGTTTLIDSPNDTYKGRCICCLQDGLNYNEVVLVFTRYLKKARKGVISVDVKNIKYFEIIDLKEENN